MRVKPDVPDLSRSPSHRRARAALGGVMRRLPSQCGVCGRWCRGVPCPECRERYLPNVSRCQGCGLRLAGEAPRCLHCAATTAPWERTVCVADYAFPWDRLIGTFKFGRAPELASWLAPLLAQAVRQAQAPLPHLVLPVPLHPTRLAERGYNQAWEIARRVATELALDARADLLVRMQAGAPQAGLGRAERLVNLRAAFAVEPVGRTAVAGRRVALVDDVMTTGATLHRAAEALQRAGAAAVQAWVIARTPG